MTAGVQSITGKSASQLGAQLTYSSPQYNNGVYVFSDVKATIPGPGSYQLIAIAEGIESKRSATIEVNDKPTSLLDQILGSVQQVLVYLILGATILINMKYTNKYLTLAMLPLLVTEIAVVSGMNGASGMYQAFANTVLVLLLWVSVYLCYKELVFKVEADHKAKRDEMFSEYTYQQLFHRPSARYKGRVPFPHSKTTVPVTEKPLVTSPPDASIAGLSPLPSSKLLRSQHRPSSAEPEAIGSRKHSSSTLRQKLRRLLRQMIGIIKPFEWEYDEGKMVSDELEAE